VNIDIVRSEIKGDIGRKIFFYNTVGSTNTVALELAEETEEGAVVISESQEKGRGRLGRSWVSPPGLNIYMSIILRPRIEPEHATLITILSAVACTHALRKTTGLAIAVKWPNDLMVSNRKLGGILTEIKTTRKEIVIAVIGIGINVNMEAGDFPEQIRMIATSVKNETGKSFTREPIVSAILNETDRWYRVLHAGQKKEIISEWQRLTSTLGKQVLVTAGQETYTGLAEAIDDGGMLLVRLSTGETKRISSGDLTVLK
jgi:BirA family transcriptional regulator, biotin operon repressor / biotin---[acetyl-CoA-carboxylase] ligase